MNKKEAKALGRWCDKHQQKSRRVAMGNGMIVNGCPECVTEPSFVAAMDEVAKALMDHALQEKRL